MNDPDPERRLVLLTGATGFVGGLCRQHWGDRYDLRLADVRPMAEAVDSSRTPGQGDMLLAQHEEFVQLDISDYGQFLSACDCVHTVIHLAATPGGPQASYSSDTGSWGPSPPDDPEPFMNELM